MSLETTPARAAHYTALLDALCETGMNVNRVLTEELMKDDIDPATLAALGAAANAAASGVRRAIMLSCSLERLMAAAPVPPRTPADASGRGKPDPNAYHPDRGDRLDRPDPFDRPDHPNAAPLEDQIASIERIIKAAAAAIPTSPIDPPLDPAPRPARPTSLPKVKGWVRTPSPAGRSPPA